MSNTLIKDEKEHKQGEEIYKTHNPETADSVNCNHVTNLEVNRVLATGENIVEVNTGIKITKSKETSKSNCVSGLQLDHVQSIYQDVSLPSIDETEILKDIPLKLSSETENNRVSFQVAEDNSARVTARQADLDRHNAIQTDNLDKCRQEDINSVPGSTDPQTECGKWDLTTDDLQSFNVVCSRKETVDSKQNRSPTLTRETIKTLLGHASRRTIYSSPLESISQVVRKKHIKLKTLLHNPSYYGFPKYLPCVQCREDYVTMSRRRPATYHIDEGRCQNCGGRVTSMAELDGAIEAMRRLIKENNFKAHDVCADGNCMFAAVNDQLRIQGHFEYTVGDLRMAAVDYLRDNPVSMDGTHFEMFLSNETWFTYLSRMSQDGQWGDHLVLRALSSVLQRRILVYGGTTGNQVTVIDAKSDTGCASHQDINLGHIIESHYISLQTRNWTRRCMTQDSNTAKKKSNQNSTVYSKIPISLDHVNFLLSLAFQVRNGQSQGQSLEILNTFPFGKGFIISVGAFVSNMTTGTFPTTDDRNNVFFPTVVDDAPETESVDFFLCPYDSVVRHNIEIADVYDLIVETDVSKGPFHLLPKTPQLWRVCTTESDGKYNLLHMDVDASKITCNGVKMSELSCIAKHRVEGSCVMAFCMDWPENAVEWITRDRPSGMPKESVVETVYLAGCHAVPFSCDPRVEFDSSEDLIKTTAEKVLWDISFAVAEKTICSKISKHQRYCYIMFKCIFDTICGCFDLPHSVTSSVFFHACENIEKDKWKMQPAQCILILVKILQRGLRAKILPHYFIAERNLLNNIPTDNLQQAAEHLSSEMSNPVYVFYKILETFKIGTSDFGQLSEDVLEDMKQFTVHGSIEQSFYKVFLPAVGGIVQNTVATGGYGIALKSLIVLSEQMCAALNTKTSVEALALSASEAFNLSRKWGFCLFVDTTIGTTLTKAVCDGLPTISISYVFGPEAIRSVGEVFMPENAAIPHGNLMYPEMLYQVMKARKKHDVLIPCLKFYLKKYNSLAGDGFVLPIANHEIQQDLLSLSCPCYRGEQNYSSYYGNEYVDKLTVDALFRKLCNMYVQFYNACLWHFRLDEFREFFPRYKETVEYIDQDYAYTNLELISQGLGLNDELTCMFQELSGVNPKP